MENKYLTIHSFAAMELKEYSIILANIDNTPEKMELAKKTFREPEFWIEQHPLKKPMQWVIFN